MKAAQHSIIASLIGLSFLGFTTTSFAQQDYYKWVDSHGSTHYTTTPPPKVKGVKTRGKIKTYGWSNPTPVTQSNETATTNTTQAPRSSKLLLVQMLRKLLMAASMPYMLPILLQITGLWTLTPT